jgi:hypothetical protein
LRRASGANCGVHARFAERNVGERQNRRSGRVAEWSNAPVLKTGKAQAFVGSNPTPSAIVDARWAIPTKEERA